MLEKTWTVLLCFQKHHVYESFAIEYPRLYNCDFPTESFSHGSDAVTVTTSKLIKQNDLHDVDAVCDELARRLRDAIDTYNDAESLKASKMKDIRTVVHERAEYRKKQEKAVLFSNKYCLTILDGADQSGFGWPHSVTKSKNERGHALRIRLIGLLKHRKPSNVYLFFVTEEHTTGVSHIIETIHRLPIWLPFGRSQRLYIFNWTAANVKKIKPF